MSLVMQAGFLDVLLCPSWGKVCQVASSQTGGVDVPSWGKACQVACSPECGVVYQGLQKSALASIHKKTLQGLKLVVTFIGYPR